MCTPLSARFWQLGLRGPSSVVVLSLLLIAGCDTGGPGDPSDPPGADPPQDDTSDVTSTTVTVQSDTLALPGTLLEPDTSAAVPGVVLVHGSGAIDRNGQDPQGRVPPIFKRWAERMVDRGVAVLRYDKRTTQPEAARADPRALTFLDFVRDAVAAGRLLRDREAVDGNRIVFVGHSQGGNVAPAAATRLDGAAGAASLAGPALAIDSLLVAQLRASPSTPNAVAEAARAQFDSLRAGTPPSDSLIEVGGSRAGVTFFQQWIRHTEHLDSVAASLDAPMFAQQGRADARYPGETLVRSLNGWRHITRTDDATLKVYDGVDHNFQVEGTDSTATAIDDLITWIRNR
jgi:dienelactone hydrolase